MGVGPSDPKQTLCRLFAGVRSEVNAILESEVAVGGVRCSDDGIGADIDLDLGGSWTASIWNLEDRNTMLIVESREGPDGTWRVRVAPLKSEWPPRVLNWPSHDFEPQLRAAVATLRGPWPPLVRVFAA
jgi:hypothetical protein